MSALWKVNCMENKYPGMWQRWYKNQCVAVGWYSEWGFYMGGKAKDRGWSVARKALKEMKIGDHVIVALQGHRIGRIGQITGKAIDDDEWNPLVPVSELEKDGEMGRRIFVRWDLTVGPDDQDLVIQLPSSNTLTTGELRNTISRVSSFSIDEIKNLMNDPTNWVSLLGKFKYEKALSDYISNYPNYLEDGLLPHPDSKIREKVFRDRSRLDVLLIDKRDNPVIVECKQYGPSHQSIDQLRHYMRLLKEETNRIPRGILVHGGAQKMSEDIINYARLEPHIEIVSYTLEVIFRPSYII